MRRAQHHLAFVDLFVVAGLWWHSVYDQRFAHRRGLHPDRRLRDRPRTQLRRGRALHLGRDHRHRCLLPRAWSHARTPRPLRPRRGDQRHRPLGPHGRGRVEHAGTAGTLRCVVPFRAGLGVPHRRGLAGHHRRHSQRRTECGGVPPSIHRRAFSPHDGVCDQRVVFDVLRVDRGRGHDARLGVSGAGRRLWLQLAPDPRARLRILGQRVGFVSVRLFLRPRAGVRLRLRARRGQRHRVHPGDLLRHRRRNRDHRRDTAPGAARGCGRHLHAQVPRHQRLLVRRLGRPGPFLVRSVRGRRCERERRRNRIRDRLRNPRRRLVSGPVRKPIVGVLAGRESTPARVRSESARRRAPHLARRQRSAARSARGQRRHGGKRARPGAGGSGRLRHDGEQQRRGRGRVPGPAQQDLVHLAHDTEQHG